MSHNRVLSMAKKDIILTTRESFFLYMIMMPIVATLVINAALGSVGASNPTLAVYGDENVASLLISEQSVDATLFSSIEALQDAVMKGEYDAGLIASQNPKLLFSGKSLLNERAILWATASYALKESYGEPDTIAFDTRTLSEEGLPLKVRLIPFLLILSAMIGGLIISSSLIEEREQKTLDAVLVTPMTPFEVIMSKSLYGLFLGLVLGIIILVLNNSLNSPLVVLFLLFGTLFTVGLGLIAGVVMDNITDLIARMKIFQLFIQLPALIVLFPQIPQWLGKLVPTYYFINPILEITQNGAVWADVWWQWAILVVCDILILLLASRVLKKRMTGENISH